MTIYTKEFIDNLTNFNPHTREGCDVVEPPDKAAADDISIHTPAKGVTTDMLGDKVSYTISIHTPAKGVTRRACPRILIQIYFNPHTREGCDSIYLDDLTYDGIFQSTHPRRV